MADFYPAGMDARAAWHANLALRAPSFEAKYPILALMKSEIIADNLWMKYWVQGRHDADTLKQQLTKYFNDISGNSEATDQPAPIIWTLAPGAPAEVPTGIEKRARDYAKACKGQIDYSKADGEALGFEAAIVPGIIEGDITAEFTIQSLVGFELKATFRKYGLDAMRFEFRYKAGIWQPAATLIVSPGTFAVAPQTPGTAEQIELRSVFLKGNAPFGNYSDSKSALIAP